MQPHGGARLCSDLRPARLHHFGQEFMSMSGNVWATVLSGSDERWPIRAPRHQHSAPPWPWAAPSAATVTELNMAGKPARFKMPDHTGHRHHNSLTGTQPSSSGSLENGRREPVRRHASASTAMRPSVVLKELEDTVLIIVHGDAVAAADPTKGSICGSGLRVRRRRTASLVFRTRSPLDTQAAPDAAHHTRRCQFRPPPHLGR